MDRKEFQKIYKQFFPFGDSSQYSHLVFNTIDTNKDGEIDFKEFMASLSVSAKASMDERLAWVFRLYDLDEDGFISRAEMLCIVDAVFRMLEPTADLPESENTPQKRVDKIFKTMDLVLKLT